ncbi:hypothetical protein B0H13DRAFT_2269603, partial [Mycena leptocephala]
MESGVRSSERVQMRAAKFGLGVQKRTKPKFPWVAKPKGSAIKFPMSFDGLYAMTREQTTCLLIPRSKPAQKKDLSDVLSSPLPIIIPPSSGGPRPSIRCIPRRIPQDYRAIKHRKTATFFGARGNYVSWIRKSSRAPERSTMAVDRKILSQLGMNLQLARSGMVSYSRFHPIRPSTLASTFRRHRVELLLGLPASSEIRATSTQLEDSAQPTFDAAGIGKCDRFRAAQPVRLPLLPFLDELYSQVASRLLT